MPNWCFNRLQVVGPDADVTALREAVVGEEPTAPAGAVAPPASALSLQRIVPMPAELEGTQSPRDDPNSWYPWRLDHWGTKWDVQATLEQDTFTSGVRTLMYVFDSAWSPPEVALETLAERFPSCALTLQFAEAANNFDGERIWSGGEIQESWTGDYTGQFDGGEPEDAGEEEEVERASASEGHDEPRSRNRERDIGLFGLDGGLRLCQGGAYTQRIPSSACSALR